MVSIALQSKDHGDLLDVVDSLRSKGISQYVALPEIIVCGDQSAGKSSVLEAISGISFPTKDILCTRFATELVLRRCDSSGVKASIIPGPDRTPNEKDILAAVQLATDSGKPDIGKIIEQAKSAMGLSDAKVFSTDTLRVELWGPSQPHLTMVDLPGLFRAGNSDQSVDDSRTIRAMVRGYMRRPRSIILAVVSAKSDFALQEVTELARELDPKGTRTLGLITKPDTLDAGSDSETSYLKLAHNRDVVFRLGWHVLKNRSYGKRHISSEERDADEQVFFATGVWTCMDPSHVGVKSLKPRLSNVLKDQILHQLPSLIEDVESNILNCENRLKRLGDPRAKFEDQRRYLLRISQEFSVLMTAALDGSYNHCFFGSSRDKEGYQKRLRAVVQNQLASFANDLHKFGHRRKIVDTGSGVALKPNEISRVDYTNEVKELMNRNRGIELPGTFNPVIIGELFTDQCQPWWNIATTVKDNILQAVYDLVRAILEHIAVEETAENLFVFMWDAIEEQKNLLDRQVTELLDPHYNSHPITHNHYFIDIVQRLQERRRRDACEKVLKEFFDAENMHSTCHSSKSVAELLSTLQKVDVNMDQYASDLVVTYMQAYYKVALKKFVDDFSVLAIEQCLIRGLPTIFNSNVVYDMSNDRIASLAAESESMAAERILCLERRNALVAGLGSLEQLDKHRFRRRGYSDALEEDQSFTHIESRTSIASDQAAGVATDQGTESIVPMSPSDSLMPLANPNPPQNSVPLTSIKVPGKKKKRRV